MKKIKLIFLILFMCVAMVGCSKEKEVNQIDLGQLSDELLTKEEFEDKLNQIDDSMVKKLYNIDDYVEARVYIGSGATAEELALFEFRNEKDAKEGLELVLVRIANQKDDFSSYLPQEVSKLDHAMVKQWGKYVFVCVSNHNFSEEIILQYLQKE